VRHWRRIAASAIYLLVLSSSAWADNSTSAGAILLIPGQGPLSYPQSTSATGQRWFAIRVYQQRSYCVTTQAGQGEVNNGDSVVTVFRQDATTTLATSDDVATEPGGGLPVGNTVFGPSPACW